MLLCKNDTYCILNYYKTVNIENSNIFIDQEKETKINYIEHLTSRHLIS